MEKRRRWYQDNEGNTSSMRIFTGIIVVVASIAVLGGVYGMIVEAGAAGTAMTTGAGLAASANGIKAWQKRSESSTS